MKEGVNKWFITFKALCGPPLLVAVPSCTASRDYTDAYVQLMQKEVTAHCKLYTFSLSNSLNLNLLSTPRKCGHHSQGCPLGGRLVAGLPGVVGLPAPLQCSLLVPAPLAANARGGAKQAGERKRDIGGPRQQSQPQTHWHCQRFFKIALKFGTVQFLYLSCLKAPYYTQHFFVLLYYLPLQYQWVPLFRKWMLKLAVLEISLLWCHSGLW